MTPTTEQQAAHRARIPAACLPDAGKVTLPDISASGSIEIALITMARIRAGAAKGTAHELPAKR